MFQVLQEFGPPEAFQTGELCIMMDKFFDCCNVRNTFEWKHKRKEYMKPKGMIKRLAMMIKRKCFCLYKPMKV